MWPAVHISGGRAIDALDEERQATWNRVRNQADETRLARELNQFTPPLWMSLEEPPPGKQGTSG